MTLQRQGHGSVSESKQNVARFMNAAPLLIILNPQSDCDWLPHPVEAMMMKLMEVVIMEVVTVSAVQRGLHLVQPNLEEQTET